MASNKQHKVKHRHPQAVYASRVIARRARKDFIPNVDVWSGVGVGYDTNGNKRNRKWFDLLEQMEIAEGRFAGDKVTGWKLHSRCATWSENDVAQYVIEHIADFEFDSNINRWFRV